MNRSITILFIAAVTLLLFAGIPGAAASDRIISSGEDFVFNGIAEGSPGTVKYYIFGPNYFYQGSTDVTNSKYTIKMKTKNMATGEYIIVVQHPMYDKLFNVQVGNSETGGQMACVYATTGDNTLAKDPMYTSAINTRQSANAAYALIDLINLEGHDDSCIVEEFTITNPVIEIQTPVKAFTRGEDITLSGTTNLNPGTQITVEIASNGGFASSSKTGTPDSAYIAQNCKVVKGSAGVNTWSVTLSNPNLGVGKYRVTALAQNGLSDDTTFTVVERSTAVPVQTPQITTPVPTLAQTQISTPVPTLVQTAVPMATQTPVPTQTPSTPGFGFLAAIAGLAAAGIIVLRR